MNKALTVKTASGEEMVVIPRAEYEALLAAARDEDDDDIALYDARKAALAESKDGILPEEVSALMLRGASRLGALRRWRGVTQSSLAAKTGVAQGYLSDIERRKRSGTPETLAKLAKILKVPKAWLA